MLDLGWSWAALAVVVGFLARRAVAAASAGPLTLLSAVTACYAADSFLRRESFGGYTEELVYWAIVSLVAGPLLGLAGATVRLVTRRARP